MNKPEPQSQSELMAIFIAWKMGAHLEIRYWDEDINDFTEWFDSESYEGAKENGYLSQAWICHRLEVEGAKWHPRADDRYFRIKPKE